MMPFDQNLDDMMHIKASRPMSRRLALGVAVVLMGGLFAVYQGMVEREVAAKRAKKAAKQSEPATSGTETGR